MGKTRGHDRRIKMSNQQIRKILQPLFMVAVVLIFLSSCKPNSKFQNPGEPILQGTWIQESVPYQDELIRYALHEFRFSCDSVYIKIKNIATQPVIVDSCYNNGEWMEYAKGLYVIRNDSLLIEATYTYEDGRQKLKGCYNIGQYLPRLHIEEMGADSLYLKSPNSDIPIQMRKVAAADCVPKQVY